MDNNPILVALLITLQENIKITNKAHIKILGRYVDRKM